MVAERKKTLTDVSGVMIIIKNSRIAHGNPLQNCDRRKGKTVQDTAHGNALSVTETVRRCDRARHTAR